MTTIIDAHTGALVQAEPTSLQSTEQVLFLNEHGDETTDAASTVFRYDTKAIEDQIKAVTFVQPPFVDQLLPPNNLTTSQTEIQMTTKQLMQLTTILKIAKQRKQQLEEVLKVYNA
jgi:hypothetical protein